MMQHAAVWQHRLFTHFTTIKLANQILERQPGLSVYQCRLVRTAIQAADELTADLLENLEPSETGSTSPGCTPGGRTNGRRGSGEAGRPAVLAFTPQSSHDESRRAQA